MIDLENVAEMEVELEEAASFEVEMEEAGPPGPQGEPGKDGIDGKDGLSAYQIYLNAGGTLSEVDWLDSLKGSPGEPGKDGSNGKDGYTPVKGTDYWTNEDKKEIESYIDNQLGVIENASY